MGLFADVLKLVQNLDGRTRASEKRVLVETNLEASKNTILKGILEPQNGLD